MLSTRRQIVQTLGAISLVAPLSIAVARINSALASKDRSDMRSVQLDHDLRSHLAQLPVIRNKPAEIADGAPLVVNFFASWCPPCHPEARALTNLARIWQPRGVEFLSLNIFEMFGGQDNPERLASFLDRHQPPFPVLKAQSETAALFGGVDRIPTLFVFDQMGRTRFLFVHETGATKMSASQEEIQAALLEIASKD